MAAAIQQLKADENLPGMNVRWAHRFWPIRSYDWGNCEALSSRHSDLSALKKLLFEVVFEELKEHTEQRYHKFRQNTLFNLDDPNRWASSLPPNLLPSPRTEESSSSMIQRNSFPQGFINMFTKWFCLGI